MKLIVLEGLVNIFRKLARLRLLSLVLTNFIEKSKALPPADLGSDCVEGYRQGEVLLKSSYNSSLKKSMGSMVIVTHKGCVQIGEAGRFKKCESSKDYT